MTTIDRRSFIALGGSAAALATFSLAGCGGGGETSFPAVSTTTGGPLAAGKDGSKFQAVGNDHSLLVTTPAGTQKRVGGLGKAAGKLNFPAGVAILNGLAYVVEAGNHRVQVFDGAGNSVGMIGEGQLFHPAGIATSTTEIFVSDTRNARIVAFSPSGQVTRTLGVGILSAPRGLTVVEGGVIVADPGLHKVLKLSFNGGVDSTYRSDLFLPYDVATDGDAIYIAEVSGKELKVADANGCSIATIPLQAAPYSVAFRNGSLYVS
ncbi:MAG: NHL repeat-containing protein [Ramlibacter sp.]|nr:NHL repeat-containing protein [Ramlibacter sp.]